MNDVRMPHQSFAPVRSGSQSPPSGPQRQPAVLIIDDDVEMLSALEIYLDGNGYAVKTASRGVDGLRLVMANDFDAIVCDMVMPRMPGDMFFLAVSKVKPEMSKRFVFITGHSHEPAVAAFLAATGQPVLTKPGGLDHLLEVLGWTVRAARGERPIPAKEIGLNSSARFAGVR
jgi:DNA-binding NtrC family response regulator